MKKNFKIKALILLVVLALTSGCIKVETGMKISLTKNVEGFYIMGIMDSMVGQNGVDASSFGDSSKELKEKGYKVADYKEDGYTGIKATKSLGNLDDLSYEGEVRVVDLDKVDENTKYFKVEKGFLKNTYTAKFKTEVSDNVIDQIENEQKEENTNPDEEMVEELEVETMVDEVNEPETPATDPSEDETPIDSSSDDTANDATPPEDDGSTVPKTNDDENPIENEDNNNILDDDSIDQIKQMMDVKFTIELPTKVVSSNATKVSSDGKKLEWNLMEFKEGSTIEFKFEAWNLTNVLIVGGGALLILIILIIIFVVTRKSKKKAEPASVAETPIPEVTDEKASALTPVAPTEGAQVLKPVGEATEVKEAPVTVEVPKVEEASPSIPEVTAPEPVAAEPTVPATVEVPQITSVPGVAPQAAPEEAKTE